MKNKPSRLDELDQLRLNMSPAMDSFSDLPDIAEVIADSEGDHPVLQQNVVKDSPQSTTQSNPETVQLPSITECPLVYMLLIFLQNWKQLMK